MGKYNLEEEFRKAELIPVQKFAGAGLVKKAAKSLAKFMEDSKVVDKAGKPMPVYHGGMSDIQEFDPVAYFGHKDVANQFADPEYRWGTTKLEVGEHPNVTPAYLSMKNPKVFTKKEDYEKHVMEGGLNPDKWKKLGYDGVIYAPEGDIMNPDAYFVSFDPRQIKSAIGNRGTYDPSIKDITKAGGGLIKKAVKGIVKSAEKDKFPLELKRAKALTPQQITEHADRVARQQAGEHVRKSEVTGNPKDAVNLAGRSAKESKRVQGTQYTLEPTMELRPTPTYESKVGDVNIALPGDQTISDMRLLDVNGLPIESTQEGGSLYGEGKLHLDDPLFWASGEDIAQQFQNKVTALSDLYNTDDIMAYHLAMGSDANNYAMHFADANLRAIANTDMKPKDIQAFNDIIRAGYKDAKGKHVPLDHFVGIENPEQAYLQMMEDPGLRKWFNNRMKIPSITEKLGMPNGLDIQWAITEPELRNMEINLTGHSVGKMKPHAELTDTADHFTYEAGIPGISMGKAPELAPFELAFPDATDYVRATQRPQDFTGTIQKVFPSQVVDPQQLEQMNEYYKRLREIRGFAKGGSANLEEEFKKADMITEPRLIPKAVVKALNTKRKLTPMEAKLAGEYANPENQWDVGTILQEIDPVYTIPRGAKTLRDVDYKAIGDLPKYSYSKNPRETLSKGLENLGEVAFGALDVAPAGAVFTKPGRAVAKSLYEQLKDAPAGLSIKDVSQGVPFVSSVDKAIAGHKAETMPGSQWLSWMNANAPKAAKKEAEASGLNDWLKTQPKVSKADISAFLEENRPQIRAVQKSKALKLNEDEKKEFSVLQRKYSDMIHGAARTDAEKITDDELKRYYHLANISEKATPANLRLQANAYERNAQDRLVRNDTLTAEVSMNTANNLRRRADLLEQNPLDYGSAKFEDKTEPGGKNYKETMLTLPQKPMTFDEYFMYNFPGARDKERVRKYYDEYLEEGKRTGKYEDAHAAQEQNYRVPSYHGYEDPNADVNRVAHIRTNERPTADNKRALFLEELQSDWAQKGRKHGFDTSDTPSGPYVQDTKDWTALGLKHAIKQAVDEGHDYLAWTTGAQQAERYNLANAVDNIQWHSYPGSDNAIVKINMPDGEYIKYLVNRDTGKIENVASAIGAEHLGKGLDEVIGKEVSNKILPEQAGKLENMDLSIGGEGMKGYYDKIVPQVMNDILKQYGVKDGVKLIDIGPTGDSYDDIIFKMSRFGQDRVGNPEYEALRKQLETAPDIGHNDYRGTHMGIEITPELRDKVLNEGLTHFKRGGKVKPVDLETQFRLADILTR